MFHDVGDSRLINSDAITLGGFLGKGAFGAVYSGTVISKVISDMCRFSGIALFHCQTRGFVQKQSMNY